MWKLPQVQIQEVVKRVPMVVVQVRVWEVRTRDMAQYRAFLGDVVSTMPHVAATSTFVAMEAVKEVMLPGIE